jgi:hypothetical protein
VFAPHYFGRDTGEVESGIERFQLSHDGHIQIGSADRDLKGKGGRGPEAGGRRPEAGRESDTQTETERQRQTETDRQRQRDREIETEGK